MPRRKLVTGLLLAAGLARRLGARPAPRARRRRERVDLYADDGSMDSLAEGSPEAERLLPIAHELLSRRREPRASSAAAMREAALPRGRLRPALRAALEVLPRQVPLRDAARPARAARRGDRGRRRASTSRTPCGSPAPELGAVALAAAASLESGLPFLIVRKAGEGLRHGEPARGRLRSRASASASSRTSSPPAARRSRRSRRSARPDCVSRNAICVVDREEGGVDALARARGAAAAALPRLGARWKCATNPHG